MRRMNAAMTLLSATLAIGSTAAFAQQAAPSPEVVPTAPAAMPAAPVAAQPAAKGGFEAWNRKTKQPFNTMLDKVEGKPLVVDQVAAKMMADGVAQQAWVSHFVIAPPLIVTKDELDIGIAALDQHLGLADALVEA